MWAAYSGLLQLELVLDPWDCNLTKLLTRGPLTSYVWYFQLLTLPSSPETAQKNGPAIKQTFGWFPSVARCVKTPHHEVRVVGIKPRLVKLIWKRKWRTVKSLQLGNPCRTGVKRSTMNGNIPALCLGCRYVANHTPSLSLTYQIGITMATITSQTVVNIHHSLQSHLPQPWLTELTTVFTVCCKT